MAHGVVHILAGGSIRTVHYGLVLFPSTHRGVPMFPNVWDKLSELCLLLALGACLAHKLLAHL